MPINTKQILADAFLVLCKTNYIRNIKPQDIASYCNVSRQTFYNYFQDKQEVIEYIWCQNVGDPIAQFDDYTQWSINSASVMDADWWFYKKAIKDTKFLEWHEKWLYENMLSYIRQKYGEAEITPELDDALKTWLVGACRSLPEKKAKSPNITCKEIALMHHRNMPAILLRYFPVSDSALNVQKNCRTAII